MIRWNKDWLKSKIKSLRHNGAPNTDTALSTPRPLREMAKSVDPRKVLAAIITITAAAAYCFFRWKKMGVLDEDEKDERDVIETEVSEPETRGRFKRFLAGFGAGVSAALARARHSKE